MTIHGFDETKINLAALTWQEAMEVVGEGTFDVTTSEPTGKFANSGGRAGPWNLTGPPCQICVRRRSRAAPSQDGIARPRLGHDRVLERVGAAAVICFRRRFLVDLRSSCVPS